MNLGLTIRTLERSAVKHSPEILLGFGIVSFVGTIVATSRATLKIDKVMKEANEKLDIIEEFPEKPDYTEADKKADKKIIGIQTGVKIAKEILLPAICGFATIAFFTKSYRILSTRNAGLAAALTSATAFINKYRKGVVERYGEEVDNELATGVHTVKVKEMNEDGSEEEKEYKIIDDVDNFYTYIIHSDNPIMHDYAREAPGEVDYDLDAIEWYAERQARYLNDKAFARCKRDKHGNIIKPGAVVLNEMYEVWHLPTNTNEGAVAGHLYDIDSPDGMKNEIKFVLKPCQVMDEDGEIEDVLSLSILGINGTIVGK